MSFWDLAQTAATIAAGVYGGPAAGAAVGGGLSAIRGKDVVMGTVGGYLGGMGGGGMNAAANQTALAAGTNVATVNAANAAATGLTGTTGATMTGFGGAGGFGSAAAGQGITQGMNVAGNTGLQNVTNQVTGSGFQPQNMTNTGPQFGGVRGMRAGVDFPNNTIQPTADYGGGGGYEANINDTLAGSNNTSSYYPREFTSDFSESIDITPGGNEGLQNTEIGANLNNPNTNIAKADRYNFVDQSTQMPDGGFSMSEKFDAVTNNPREFMKNLGDGNELYGAGKLGLTGLGLYGSAMEPADPYGDLQIEGNEVRNRGPQGQLNLDGLASLNVNNPYGYAEGGYLTGGNVPGDGMSDSIPAMIGRGQQAALSEGEFVVPADVVSHLGNGSSNAGSKQLYAMMDQVRKARTGNQKQGKEIKPERYMPA